MEKKLIARWETKGKKYAIEVIEISGDNPGFEINDLEHGEKRGSMWRPISSYDRDRVILEAEEHASDAAKYNIHSINYKRIDI